METAIPITKGYCEDEKKLGMESRELNWLGHSQHSLTVRMIAEWVTAWILDLNLRPCFLLLAT